MRMEFKDYLKMCRSVFSGEDSIPVFMMNFFADLVLDEEAADDDDKCPFQKESNADKAISIYYGKRKMPVDDALYMKLHFNEEKLKSKVDSLPSHIQQNLIDVFVNEGLEVSFDNLADVMCDTFKGFMVEMSQAKRKTAEKKRTKMESDRKVNEEDDYKTDEPKFDSRTMELAQNFCMDYEEQMKYLVLCQIAEQIQPLHRHVRSIYTAYLQQNEDVRKAILNLCGISVMHFKKDWQYIYLEEFRKDIFQLKIVNGNDFLYDSGKYFFRAINYADYEIKEKNPRIFPIVPTRYRINTSDRNKDDLLSYIKEYLYYKENDKYFKYVKEPPFDWMICHLNLPNIDESELTYWMSLFIYNSCMAILSEGPKRNKDLGQEHDKWLAADLTVYDADRMEDLYYLALYALYSLYSEDHQK